MRRHEHHTALVAQIAQKRDDRLLGLHVDAGEGFVEEDYPTLLGERPGKKDALLLAAGQFADLAMAEVRHADALERFRDGLAVLAGRDAQEVHAAVTAHHHHVLDEDRKALQSTSSDCGT